MLKSLSLHELHRIEVTASGSTQMENRGNIRVADAGGGPRLAQETKLDRYVAQIAIANDLQSHRTPEIDIERLVGDAHGATTQLDRSTIVVQDHFIVLEAANSSLG